MNKIVGEMVVGVDIGGTSIKFALINKEGVIVKKDNLKTSNIQDEYQFFQLFYEKIESLFSPQNRISNLEGIGIGAPGFSSQKGIINNAINLPFLQNLNIVSIIQEKYNVPVFLTKDSNAAALGEKKYGVATSMKNFILITLGTGLGCAIVVNGRIVKGANGLAGEFGHSIIIENGRECGCGKRGCLETYASGSGLVRTVMEMLADSKEESILREMSFQKITPKLIYQAAKKGDQIALQAFDNMGETLGKKLTTLLTLFDPEAIVLAGGLAKSGNFLLNPIINSIEENILPFFKGHVNILFSSLKTNEAALLGAGSLVWENQKLNVI